MLSLTQMKIPKNILTPLFLFSIVFLILLNLFQFFNNQDNTANNIPSKTSEEIAVLGVIDGDTIVLEGKTRLRLRGLDAPELNYCLGPEAKTALENLVSGKKIISRDQIIDKFGRPMALVYQGNKFINLEMIKLGLVRYHSDNHSQKEVLKKAYNEAQLKEIGIFSLKCTQQKVNPENPKCNIKGNIDKNAQKSRLYYIPGCVHYKAAIVEKDIGESWFCTEKEARDAGYIKSSRCS